MLPIMDRQWTGCKCCWQMFFIYVYETLSINYHKFTINSGKFLWSFQLGIFTKFLHWTSHVKFPEIYRKCSALCNTSLKPFKHKKSIYNCSWLMLEMRSKLCCSVRISLYFPYIFTQYYTKAVIYDRCFSWHCRLCPLKMFFFWQLTK